MKKRFWIAFGIAAAAGTGLHFLYALLPLPLTALIAPVSESVWEHLKLLYWPFLIAAAVLSRSMKEPLRAWSGFLTALLLQPLVLTAIYYLLRSGFGIESMWLDIGLYYVVLGAGFFLAYALYGSGRTESILGLLIVLAAIYGVSLMVFSLAAPHLPIFAAP